ELLLDEVHQFALLGVGEQRHTVALVLRCGRPRKYGGKQSTGDGKNASAGAEHRCSLPPLNAAVGCARAECRPKPVLTSVAGVAVPPGYQESEGARDRSTRDAHCSRS